MHHLQARGEGTISRKVGLILQASRVQENLGNHDFGGINLDIPKPYVSVLFVPRKHPDFGIANLFPLGV